MGKVVNEELNEQLYSTFWRKLQQSKFDLIYYDVHFKKCTTISRWIKYAIIAVTSLATGAWMNWNSIAAIGNICAVVILAAQVVSAISEKFPYESRRIELREMIDELESVYFEMENDWRTIQSLKMSNSKIQEAIKEYDNEQAKIKRHYFKEDSLPESERLRLQADIKTEEYFNYFK